jgi:hypothetical protein
MIFMFMPVPGHYYVADAQCFDEALLKALNMKVGPAGRETNPLQGGGVEVIECPELLASTPETREIMYGKC